MWRLLRAIDQSEKKKMRHVTHHSPLQIFLIVEIYSIRNDTVHIALHDPTSVYTRKKNIAISNFGEIFQLFVTKKRN